MSHKPIVGLVLVIALLLDQPYCHALFCADWCEEPYCSCRDVIPGLRGILENALGFLQQQSASNNSPLSSSSWSSPLSDCVPQTGSCNPGFSGRQCRCGFSRTNIADHSVLVPDSQKGSLTITSSSNSHDSNVILAGTWQAGYEATRDDPSHFVSWFPEGVEENVWSVGKTKNGNELIGSHSWIRLKRPGESSFSTTVLNVGTQGGFVVLEDSDRVFAGTFEGLYTSIDGGETWTKSPKDCESYNFPDDPTNQPPPPNNGPPKPPNEAKYCDAPVTHMFLLEDGSLIVFYMGYGGAHQLPKGDHDPLLSESWVALPSFQDTETCQSGFCHAYDAAVHNNYMYVAFQSLPMVRIDINAKETWEKVPVGNGNLYPTAIATANDGRRLLVATSDGIYQSSNGMSWERVPDDACSDRDKPPLMGRGMIESSSSTNDDSSGGTTIVFGTVLGPWIYTGTE